MTSQMTQLKTHLTHLTHMTHAPQMLRLSVVRSIRRPAKGIADSILSHLVHHGVEDKLVGAHQLRDVLHDRHHLLGIGTKGVHPPGDVEAHNAAAPGRQQWRRDLQGLGHTMAVDHDLRLLQEEL